MYYRSCCEGLNSYLITEFDYYKISGLKFNQMSQLNITFTTDFEYMTSWCFFEQAKHMSEWVLKKKICKNLNLKRVPLPILMGYKEYNPCE